MEYEDSAHDEFGHRGDPFGDEPDELDEQSFGDGFDDPLEEDDDFDPDAGRRRDY